MNGKLADLTSDLGKKLGSTSGESHKKVEEKVDVLISTVKTDMDKRSGDDQEAEEIKKRKTNLIIQGCRESLDADVEGKKKDDGKQIINHLHDIGCDDVSVSNMIRLGQRKEGTGMTSRPIKLVVASEEQRDRLIHNAKA